eukprot:900203-Prymnesium_polylepis.1
MGAGASTMAESAGLSKEATDALMGLPEGVKKDLEEKVRKATPAESEPAAPADNEKAVDDDVDGEQAAREAADRAAYEAAVAEAKIVPLPAASTWHKLGGAELEPLLAFTVLGCVRWLLKFAKGEVMPERKGAVPACQELPADAKVKVEQLRTSKWNRGLPVGVLSYGWASKSHLDPTGAQLKLLIPLLEAIVAECDKIGGVDFTWGILWDFMALPQRGHTKGYSADEDDRTPEQLETFRRWLGNINGACSMPHSLRLHIVAVGSASLHPFWADSNPFA